MVYTIDNEINSFTSEPEYYLSQTLKDLPEHANEGIVDNNFIATSFFKALGFNQHERVPSFQTGTNRMKVDYALRKNTASDNFIHTQRNPFILVELKGRDINLEYGSASYKNTVKQIKGYLLGVKCKSVQWGIITNSRHIQLFRKHGKTIFPATTCLKINPDNIEQIVLDIRQKIEQTDKALTVAIYNNKGGVGKTTTVINLAATLTRHNKKVLVLDFDPNQMDLTDSLDAKVGKLGLGDCLRNKKDPGNLKHTIYSYVTRFKGGISLSFDVIPVDESLAQTDEDDIRKELSYYALRSKLAALKSEYDYILIDAPPNWRFYSISAIDSADVVLIPTQHNNIRSLKNAAITVCNHIKEIQQNRQKKSKGLEWGAIALPIFFNGGKITAPARVNARNALAEIINQVKSQSRFDLLPYFFPRYKSGNNTEIFELPHSAYIANCNFNKIPAVYRYKVVYDYYSLLAKEYFLQ